jgi:hypothetical protein
MVTNQISNINQNADISIMKKIAWKTLIISTIIIIIISNLGNSLQNFEEYDQNPPFSLSNSDSWSKIVKEGGSIFEPYCELINGSLYVIGMLELEVSTNHYLYVSKFNTSGIKEWELSIKLDHYISYISYLFDNDNNLFISIKYPYYSDNISLIKLNSSGEILFSKEFSLDLHNHDVSLVLGENNSLLIVGYYEQHPYPERLFIMKINNVGQFLWNTSFYVDDYNNPHYIVTDSEYNIYLSFENNSIFNLAKINGSGVILWQIELSDIEETKNIMIDVNNTLCIIGCGNSNTYVLKINSSGTILKEIVINGFITDYYRSWFLKGSIVIAHSYDISMLYSYDLNLNFQWNFTLADYITPQFYGLWIFLAQDIQENVYVLQNNNVGDISLIKINKTGNFISRITWGGLYEETPRSLIIDLDNNIYFICNCEYYNTWRDRYIYAILVKNPVNGGTPPELRGRDLDIRDYLLFSVIGIACIISPIALLSILKSNKKRIG